MRDLTPLYGAVVLAVACVQAQAVPLVDVIQSIPDNQAVEKASENVKLSTDQDTAVYPELSSALSRASSAPTGNYLAC